MGDSQKVDKVPLYKYWRLFELGLAAIYAFAVASAIAIVHNPEWHPHLLRLFGRTWDAFVAQDVGSTARGFLSATLEAVLSVFAVAFMAGYLHGFNGFRKHVAETAIITLFAIPTMAALVYGTQFAYELARMTYADHRMLGDRLEHLQGYAKKESQFQSDLSQAKAEAAHWRDAYTGTSHGERVPDRIMNREDTEKLHDKLKEYRLASKERKYSTVKIGPAFGDDRDSVQLADQLLRVFKDAGWNATWEAKHSKELESSFRLSWPIGITIYSDDPNGEAFWIMRDLATIDLSSTVTDRLPSGFNGTLVCIGYKKFDPPRP
jgi:hypothetical protein